LARKNNNRASAARISENYLCLFLATKLRCQIFVRVLKVHPKQQSEALQGVQMALACGMGTPYSWLLKNPSA
jgi:hypothetical protein